MPRRLRISDMATIAVPEQPAIAPDGGRIVYVLRTQDVEADRAVTALWRVNTAGGAPARLTTGTADSMPAWSPDGTRIAFLRAQDGPAQLWLLPADGGEPEQLTTLPLGAGRPVWSPDGAAIAFAASVDIVADPGEDDAARTSRTQAPIVADRLDYHADGSGLLRTIRTHLHVLDLATGECRQVSEGDWNATQPAWSPDTTRLAFTAATAPDRDLNHHQAVYVLDVTDARNRPVLTGFGTGDALAVTWTADGATLLVAGTAHGPTGPVGLYRLPVTGAVDTPAAELTNLIAALDRSVIVGVPSAPGGLPPRLVDGGAAVLFCVRGHGGNHLYRVGVAGGTPQPVLAGENRVVTGVSVSGTLAAVGLGTATSFGEIITVDLTTGAETVHTGHGAHLADVDWFAPQSREFTISDGTVVPGWLFRDPGRTGPLPLLLDIHGGPHGAWDGVADASRVYVHELARRGWAVLLLNPRASDGYGARFHTQNTGKWGTGDMADFLEPIDTLVAEGVADAQRLAVTGYSYGGYMTCYLTSRDQRFAAAVVGAPVSDPASFAGTSDAGHLLCVHELDGLPWHEHDRERIAAQSPIERVSDVRTPTLVIQGTDDVRCPIGQSQQWYAGLREQGVPSRLVLYPGGSHLFLRTGPLSHRLDFNERVVEWVERYAGSASGPRPSRLDEAHWRRRLDVLARRHHVPGAQLGILRVADAENAEDELITAAHGVLNIDTGVTTTTDSLFHIGSITKVWTTTLLMQLVDEGALDLDAPVLDVLPELRLGDPEATKQVTARQLLTHTSGIDGDIVIDTGRGDDCVQRFVALLAEAAQNFPPGAIWSYCNSGFTLAGRVIEKLTGTSWDTALRERLITPLGLPRTVTLPEEALLHRAAVGHLGGAEPVRASVWTPPRAAGPAGLIASTVADVLAFARLHLTGGLAGDGTRLLSAESAAAMAASQVELPNASGQSDSWGLGWSRFDWAGRRVIGHDGDVIGQSAALRVLPEAGLAIAICANGGNPGELYQDLFTEIAAEVAGIVLPRPPAPPAEPVEADITPWLGRYERSSARLEVLAEGPTLRVTTTGELADLLDRSVEEYTLVAAGPDRFLIRAPGAQTWAPVRFGTTSTGQRYLHAGGRAAPKTS